MTRPISQSAFSLLELLVVITIFVILIALTIPAINSILTSVERSIAQNQLRIGIAAGRDAAIANLDGDGAAVFMFEPGGRFSIIPCREIVKIRDVVRRNEDGTSQFVTRSVFIPVADSEPLQLPKGWSIRGFVPPGRTSDAFRNGNGWYEGPFWEELDGGGAWLFPENGFYDRTMGNDGRDRQTFMIRFRSGTGEVVTDNTDLCLIVDLSPELTFRLEEPWRTMRLDRFEDLETGVRRCADIVARRLVSETEPAPERLLMGDESSDSVLAGPVIALALYEEENLARGIGLRGVNRKSRTIYENSTAPTLDLTLRRDRFISATSATNRIDKWIVGLGEEGVESVVRLFVIQSNTAELEEITP